MNPRPWRQKAACQKEKLWFFSISAWQPLKSYINLESQGGCSSHILMLSCLKWAITPVSSFPSLHWVLFLTRSHIPSTFPILNPFTSCRQPVPSVERKKLTHFPLLLSPFLSEEQISTYFPSFFFLLAFPCLPPWLSDSQLLNSWTEYHLALNQLPCPSLGNRDMVYS